MYKTILVPLDGSPRAERILVHVEDMALRYDAAVVLLQVVSPIIPVMDPDAFLLELGLDEIKGRINDATAYLANLESELVQKGIQVRTIVDHGSVVETIINMAGKEGADLIAMASHGRSGLSRVFYGSVAAGVLQHVDRPLLLIRARNDA
ncbi:MAG: universal stress protein [Deltaproteobacteria bacterium]|nr:universal stress protein [Deltaproteobacteria bacterium]MBW2193313.1 universal stress protein [Deltaproteobacteria bacterium]